MAIETTRWDAADSLDSPEAELAYLEAAFEDGTSEVIAAAIGAIARARGSSLVARQAEISRDTLYKAFAHDGNPTLSTMLAVLKAVQIELRPASRGGLIRKTRQIA